MDIAAYVEELERQGLGLAAAADSAGDDAAVPTCPGWTVADLLGHVGTVHRWAIEHVSRGREAFDGGRAVFADPPASGRLAWFVEGHRALLAALRAAPAELDCWTFLPAPTPLTFWARRQAHETAVHRADAEAARGAPSPSYPVDFATDGLAELLELFWGRRRGALVSDPPTSLAVIPADSARRWHIAVGTDRRTITIDGDLPAQCTLHGTVSDLYLAAWNRPTTGPVTVDGDPEVLELWRHLAHITW